MGRQVEGERSVPALILTEAHAVDPNSRCRHRAFKVHEDSLAASFGRKPETAAIDGDELVFLFIEAVPFEPDVGMRNHNTIETGIVKILRVSSFGRIAAETPIAIHGEDQTSTHARTTRLRNPG